MTGVSQTALLRPGVALLLLTGMALGPSGAGILSADALAILDPVLPLALGVIGVLIGLAIGAPGAGDRRLFGIASLEAGLTGLLVGVGITMVSAIVIATPGMPSWMLGLLGGICAAVSSAMPSGNPTDPGADAERIIHFDIVLAIVAGGLMLAFVRAGSVPAALSLAGQASLVALLVAMAGWLLLTQAPSETEQRVFAVASLLLVGGAADYLSLSALLGGLLAGMFWQRAGGQAREHIRRDALYTRHPLLVLLLLLAGARVEFSPNVIGIAAVYFLLRTVGKLASAGIGRRLLRPVPRDLAFQLLSPGVFGIAFALNTVRAVGAEASILLTITVIGTIASELLATLAQPREMVA